MFKYNLSFLLIFLSGCALFSTPELKTINDKIAFVEIGYTEILKTATLYREAGLLTDSEIAQVTSFITETRKALDIIYIARDTGDLTTAETQLQVLSSSLEMLRKYLINKEKSK